MSCRHQPPGFQPGPTLTRPLHPQKIARGLLKFQILEADGFYYLCSKNEGADQCVTARLIYVVTPQLICAFVFAYAKSRFSHDVAHIISRINQQKKK